MKKKLKLVFTFISTVAIMRIAMHNILGKNRILKDGEVTTEANYLNDHRTEASEWKPKYIYDFTKVELLPSIPNPEFVFHNKLPKCGSTTMNDIVKALSHRNNFNYRAWGKILKIDESARKTKCGNSAKILELTFSGFWTEK